MNLCVLSRSLLWRISGCLWLGVGVLCCAPTWGLAQEQNVGEAQTERLQARSERLESMDNVALDAQVSASSQQEGQTAQAAIDGVAGGYPDAPGAEWASGGEREGATLRLTWKTAQTVDHVQLFDRPNGDDNVTSGLLSLSDGTTLKVGTLASWGTLVHFSAKTISWLEFKMTSVSEQTQNVGLSEIAVFWAGSERGTVQGNDNVAGEATATASTEAEGQSASSAIDGEVGGFPEEIGAEWASDGEREGATLGLEWKTPQAINRVQLFDRINTNDNISAGQLTFSDGSTIDVGALSSIGTGVVFSAKTISWLEFKVTNVSEQTQNVGLAEIAVYSPNKKEEVGAR